MDLRFLNNKWSILFLIRVVCGVHINFNLVCMETKKGRDGLGRIKDIKRDGVCCGQIALNMH